MAVLVPADTQVQKSPSNYFRHLHQCRSHDLMCAFMSAAVNERTKKKIKVQSLPCQIQANESTAVPAAAVEQLYGTLFQTFPDQFRSHSRAKQMKPKTLLFLNGTKITILNCAFVFADWMPVSVPCSQHSTPKRTHTDFLIWLRVQAGRQIRHSEHNKLMMCIFSRQVRFNVTFTFGEIAKSNKRRLNGSAK